MEQKENKVGIKGWIALFVLCVMFSGVLKNAEGPLAAFDFSNLVGAWGKIGDAGQNFIGKGGARRKRGHDAGTEPDPRNFFCRGSH